MEISSARQAQVFLGMVVCGAICTLVFDIFRAVRRFKKSSVGIIAIQDLLFWAIELVIVYMISFQLNYAGIRAYLIIALIIGSVLYFVTLSEYVILFFCKIMVFFGKAIKKVLYPFTIIVGWLSKPWLRLHAFIKKEISLLKNYFCLKFKILSNFLVKKLKTIFKCKNRKKSNSNVEVKAD